ncbi:MAG: hypothetical protein ISN26_01145 [Betaproteobacteria bacterium AqS2]|uniref:RloB domain-containing protein n=1 Tax=Candidatus Amphirhobacter heronislandensis TaxID=1732024 RepID=A0A930UBT9_9GAMM|nr:hypothetical protein [Betaproteobacteria bacterium AqS2]
MKSEKPKKIFFVASEGESEESYARMLSLFATEMNLDIRIKRAYLYGGSPSVMTNEAIKKSDQYDQRVPKQRKIFIKAIFLDTDNATKAEISKITTELKRHGFIIIWQKPNHEDFLWRHFNGKGRIPPGPGKIKEDFKKFWPDYEKNYPAENLKKKIDLSKIIEVAHSLKNEGDDGFLALLEKMGLSKG